MSFNSPAFLLIFVPLLAVFYRVLPGPGRIPALLFASITFYSFEGLLPTLVLIGSVIWTWLLSLLLVRFHRAYGLLIAGIAGPLSALFLFKYAVFAANVFGLDWRQSPFADIVASYGLPAGISFYTFHAVSYVADIHSGKIKNPPPASDYLLYIIFFPQLIAGPIIRFNDVGEQFRGLRTRPLHIDYMLGIKYIAFGMAYKTFFADVLHFLKDKYVLGSGFEGAAFNILSYSMVIYYDFWGYSLMAIGLAKLFGIDLPRNFNEPYISQSPKEFWRRWHITLSSWLRDYVYIPLGGNKNYIRNIAIVFTMCGFWHGAGWNFIIWGLFHGALVIFYHLTRSQWDRLPTAVAIILTYLVVSMGWPLFYLDVSGYLQLIGDLVSPTTALSPYHIHHWIYLALVMSWTFLVREDRVLFNQWPILVLDWPAILAVIMLTSISMLSFKRTFIYFHF